MVIRTGVVGNYEPKSLAIVRSRLGGARQICDQHPALQPKMETSRPAPRENVRLDAVHATLAVIVFLASQQHPFRDPVCSRIEQRNLTIVVFIDTIDHSVMSSIIRTSAIMLSYLTP